MGRLVFGLLMPVVLSLVSSPRSVALAEGDHTSSSADPVSSRDREIQEIKREIRLLQQRVDELEGQNERLWKANTEAKSSSEKFEAATTQQLQTLQGQVDSASSPASFAEAFNRYLGNYRFTLVGGAAGSFIYDRQNNINTFALDLEPIILWRISDRMLFEGTVEANLPSGSSAEYQLPVATLQYFLNDYAELELGIFDQPFGDWYEDQSPFWVNRLVTAPLPYGAEALVQPTDLGVQLRGGVQWGVLGQDLDYTVWMSNGPSFANDIPQPVLVQALNEVNTIKVNTNGQGYGARFRVYPFPLDSGLGRLELGASTFNGKWLHGNWYNSWGVDFAYLRGPLQARGEYLEMYRQMPSANADNRQGWYVQLGYFLNQIQVPYTPPMVQDFIARLEPLVRYSGVNQRAIVQDEVSTVPETGFSGSPSIFTPHAREVALGLDYWIAPSIVWQNEVDLELPEAGGSIISFNGNPTPTVTPRGATPNDVTFLSQLAIGF